MQQKVTQRCESESRSIMSGSLWPRGLYSPWNSPGQITGVGSLSPGDLPNPGVEPRSPTLQADSLPAELQGKSKNMAFILQFKKEEEKARGGSLP